MYNLNNGVFKNSQFEALCTVTQTGLFFSRRPFGYSEHNTLGAAERQNVKMLLLATTSNYSCSGFKTNLYCHSMSHHLLIAVLLTALELSK